MPPAKSSRKPVITTNPLFNLLILINSALCLTTLGVMVWVAADSADPLPKAKERLLNACEHIFTLTAGAFIGLLGGRAAYPDRIEDGQSQQP
jgi:hypothetical protein